ncbi:hypothetical protein U9M48_025655 [Paspalum notatum var. saurae]|uniref:Uncharacterized protein n=1 Tax=Paspalum notatum var. saurae TaxID=547442 RepID=A0AAQ3TR59_PASNO
MPATTALLGRFPLIFVQHHHHLLCLSSLITNSEAIPSGIGNCSMLKVLEADHNHLATIFKEYLMARESMAKLSNLIILDLGENNFTGKIPDTIGDCKKSIWATTICLGSYTDLIMTDLKNNSFTGELARVNFSKLENLETLDLARNNFSGTIPESIYSCIKLTALRLSNNNLQRQLSKGIGNLKSISFLSLADVGLTKITSVLHILQGSKNFNTLLITHNFMNETTPDEDNIDGIEAAWPVAKLGNDDLHRVAGPPSGLSSCYYVQKNIDGFENLRLLGIGECQLLGTIPLWISKLANLEILLLNGNQLSGPIPTWFHTPKLPFLSRHIKQQLYRRNSKRINEYANANFR